MFVILFMCFHMSRPWTSVFKTLPTFLTNELVVLMWCQVLCQVPLLIEGFIADSTCVACDVMWFPVANHSSAGFEWFLTYVAFNRSVVMLGQFVIVEDVLMSSCKSTKMGLGFKIISWPSSFLWSQTKHINVNSMLYHGLI